MYVDDMRAPYRHGSSAMRMIMCHMTADSHEELVAMADKIGVARRWIQHEGKRTEHFDISLGKRALAIKEGAVEVSMREMVLLRLRAEADAPGGEKGKKNA